MKSLVGLRYGRYAAWRQYIDDGLASGAGVRFAHSPVLGYNAWTRTELMTFYELYPMIM